MAGFTPEALANSLERIRKRKQELAGGNPNSPVASRNYRDGVKFNDFAPKEMDTTQVTTPFVDQVSEQIGRVSSQATSLSGIEADNAFQFKRLQEEKARLAQAERDKIEASKAKIKPLKPLQIPTKPLKAIKNYNPATMTPYKGPGANVLTEPGSSYYTQTPGWVDPNAGLTTFKAGGHSWTLNASVADRFRKFINALTATGYTIKTAGSYSDRNQANGSGNPSLHSYGLAIDINAFGAGNSYNPGNSGKHYTNLPKGVSALAAKYGLVWGGDWKNSKDYMHFSVPYKGLM